MHKLTRKIINKQVTQQNYKWFYFLSHVHESLV